MFNSKPTRGLGLLENFLARKRAKIADKLIPKHLRKGRILDIGCGVNPFFLLNTKFNEKYGMDFSLKTTKCGENIILKSLDVEENEQLFPEGDFFDVIVMLAVFEHINPHRLECVLKEVKRMLSDNGRFILTTPCSWSKKLLKLMAKIGLISKDEINDHKSNHSSYEIIEYLHHAGFDQKKIKLGHFEFFLNSWIYVDKSR